MAEFLRLLAGGAVASLVAAVLTYRLTKRNTSGKVNTSEASQVFAAQASMADDSRELMVEYNKTLSQGLVDIQNVRAQLTEVFGQLLEAQGLIALRDNELAQQERRLLQGTNENQRLEARVRELEEVVAALRGKGTSQ